VPMTAVLQSPANWQDGFLRVLPAIETHAQITFRKLSPMQREEAIQEAIATACVSYQRMAAQNRLHAAHPSTLAGFAIQHVRGGRHVGGRQDGAKDVLSPAAHRRHGVNVLSFDSARRQRLGGEWKELVVARRNQSIADVAAFRIDFSHWLKTL